MQDYYAVLGVPKSATKEQIRLVYLRLIQKYHPDHNPDPLASEYTASLNEAYATLIDDRKRALHDAWLHSQDTQRNSQKATSGNRASEPIIDLYCSKCKRQDSTLRLTLMYYAMSFLILTMRRGASGIWCERCRAIESAKWTLLSGILGWWGLPWGPLYTLHALLINALGGKQPRDENAHILRIVGYQLYSKGNLIEAMKALKHSVALQRNVEAEQLLLHIRTQLAPGVSLRTLWSFAPVLPSGLVLTVCAFCIYIIFNRPTGYQAEYHPPAALVQNVGKSSDVASNSKTKVNLLVNQLADLVEAHAPITGSHYEGRAKVEDHVLDRAKLDSLQIYAIATQIRSEMQRGEVLIPMVLSLVRCLILSS